MDCTLWNQTFSLYFSLVLWAFSIWNAGRLLVNKLGKSGWFWRWFTNEMSSGIQRLMNRELKVVGPKRGTVLCSRRPKEDHDALLKNKWVFAAVQNRLTTSWFAFIKKYMHSSDLLAGWSGAICLHPNGIASNSASLRSQWWTALQVDSGARL